ncbi:phosphatase PAP2 family protein [Halolamina salifodinae]|uniref:Membrane-associated phospholipid phosphatase n=1 Tax=Halolamina salifodinae TaxID=1202767 RepID=A0A8T4H4C3_9EURY|nr:phosphatase PAP2 family protein [Halolamina salifodinae]MBP1988008.1 membrane-associated phospholipid phosphatase [Halolamina salifodinae]
MHGWGVTEALAALPDWVVLVFALLTQLADAWFVFAGLTLLYLLADERLASEPRRTGGLLVALGVCTIAATVTFKTAFGLHRPVGAGSATPPVWLPALLDRVFVDFATGDGFGFPSGHATSSSIVYGGLALYLDRLWDQRRRILGAVAVTATVALSRLVLGVHHLPDVLAGIATGLAVLLAVRWVAGRDPERAFLAAGTLGAISVVATLVFAPEHPEELLKAAIALGAGLGAAVAWHRTGGDLPPVPVRIAVPAGVVLGGLWGGIYVAELAPVVSAVGSAIAVGGIVAVPGVVDSLE